MRLALLSDIHGNHDALQAVLQDAEERGVDDSVCLGDVVGYGADPELCLDLVRERCSVVVAGNHDLAVAGVLDSRRFNPMAGEGVRYSRRQLGAERLRWLAELPMTCSRWGAHFVHASPTTTTSFPYVRDAEDAAAVFESWTRTGPVFFGHTHVAQSFHEQADGRVQTRYASHISLSKRCRVLCNVGSVGQPRDRDPRASYAVLDTREGRLQRVRVDYEVHRAAERIREARLPEALGQRLLLGV